MIVRCGARYLLVSTERGTVLSFNIGATHRKRKRRRIAQ